MFALANPSKKSAFKPISVESKVSDSKVGNTKGSTDCLCKKPGVPSVRVKVSSALV